jgi:hypothetical protein
VHERSRRCRRPGGGKRETGLIKHDMAGADDLLGRAMKAAMVMMLGWIPKEPTGHGAGRKLMQCNNGGVGVTQTFKDPKTSIRRIHANKSMEGNAIRDCLRGQPIMEHNRCVKSLDPEARLSSLD